MSNRRFRRSHAAETWRMLGEHGVPRERRAEFAHALFTLGSTIRAFLASQPRR